MKSFNDFSENLEGSENFINNMYLKNKKLFKEELKSFLLEKYKNKSTKEIESVLDELD